MSAARVSSAWLAASRVGLLIGLPVLVSQRQPSRIARVGLIVCDVGRMQGRDHIRRRVRS